MLNAETSREELGAKALPFLRRHGFPESAQLTVLRGGANNQVYLVFTPERRAVLKSYFRNADDLRDRFRAERAFYDLVWGNGIQQVPEPLGWDADLRVGLFAFVDGRKLSPAEVGRDRVKQAVEFVVDLNRHKQTRAAQQIPVASEACFSLAEHLSCVEQRVLRLLRIEVESDLDRQAAMLARDELEPAWIGIRDRIRQRAVESGLTLNATLSGEKRCLSPSDFGFHNALVAENDQLRFFDFEYGGWDDPAKLICDFFCQPELPVAAEHWDLFAGTLIESLVAERGLEQRARLLLSAYQIKWCCIILNDFVRVDRARRHFALGASEERKRVQLDRARRSLQRLGKE